jgi:hypothetical protein
MLALYGHNGAGNVLHLIYGPESEMFMDIHGAKVMNITELVKGMQADQPVFLSLTRCKSEAFTEATLRASNMQFLNSFTGRPVCDKPNHPVAAGQTSSGQTTHNDAKPPQRGAPPLVVGGHIPVQRGVCEYCHTECTLIPIPYMKICGECLAIELGQKKQQEQRELEEMGDK